MQSEQVSDNFIGWKSEDGQLEVVDTEGRNASGAQLFKVICEKCSKDEELFPNRYFLSPKADLLKGYKPCGCGRTHRWNEKQQLIRAKRVAGTKNIQVLGYKEDFHGAHTRVECVCENDSYTWCPTVTQIVNMGQGCPRCTKTERWNTYTATEMMQSICNSEGLRFIGFKDNFKNKSSKALVECPVHGKYIVSFSHFINDNTRCPSCASYGYDQKLPASFYLAEWTKDNHSFIKFGITNREVHVRLREQERASTFKASLIVSHTYQDGYIPFLLERQIKDKYKDFMGVVDPDDFKSGFTETLPLAYKEDLIKDIKSFVSQSQHKLKEIQCKNHL